MLVAVLAVFVAMGAVFNERVLMETMDILPLERRERFQDKCRLIIERYGLSEREGEIMIMFAKGRNLAYIQDKLFISKSTVSTHRQHIYKTVSYTHLLVPVGAHRHVVGYLARDGTGQTAHALVHIRENRVLGHYASPLSEA